MALLEVAEEQRKNVTMVACRLEVRLDSKFRTRDNTRSGTVQPKEGLLSFAAGGEEEGAITSRLVARPPRSEVNGDEVAMEEVETVLAMRAFGNEPRRGRHA